MAIFLHRSINNNDNEKNQILAVFSLSGNR